MKRNRPNPKRDHRRRRRANGDVTWRETVKTMGGKGKLGFKTQKRGEIVSPVEQERRRRRDVRSAVPAEIREIAGEMGVVLPGEET